MLEQALVALAAAGGTAVVQAAGTDAWTGLRAAVARWFGRGDGQRERAELERLDRTAAELEAAGATEEAADERIAQQVAWQTRVMRLLERLDENERERAAEDLRALLARHVPTGGTSVGRDGTAVGGDVHISATDGSAAAWQMGDVSFGNPRSPGSAQG
ncbi:hypothetical protein V1L54_10775 [Streptomyces sp. TRM 70361]|uniref:hypothetical protein n=1 Tax=Streptomyces sp. TRM 70361 TaxID=3116553 RepID=UPI002E7AE589|nr:hypothetical protein [Streptomyces sp. TRM 70361]MEE1939884.1 hypothetical protein [Streptomyces sp. TRM 70361]